MALETAAAIIGILAAAGKVAETLSPIVTGFKDVTKNIASVLSEVNTSRAILSALQKYLDNLSTSPHARRGLIQVDELAIIATDGVLIFSELEALLSKLTNRNFGIQTRIQWARNDKNFAVLLLRVQNFKISITAMLNIMQCDSDMEALRSRNELHLLASNLIRSNRELAKRIAHLEDCYGSSNVTGACGPDSLATTRISKHRNASTKRREIRDPVLPLPHAPATKSERNKAVNSQVGYGDDTNVAINFEFERVLFSSQVYHKARRQTPDGSFRSSVGLTHAWTAISDISLSDISNISVVALPLTSKDICNPQHYTFRQIPIVDSSTDHEGTTEPWKGDVHFKESTSELHNQSGKNAYLAGFLGKAYKLASGGQRPANITLIIKGSDSATNRKLAKEIYDTLSPYKIVTYGDSYTCEVFVPQEALVKGSALGASKVSIDLNIQVVNDEKIPEHMTRAHLDRQLSEKGDLFMLIYSSVSKTSFLRILRYSQEVLRNDDRRHRCILVVSTHHGLELERQHIGVGRNLAADLGGKFVEINIDSPEVIQAAFKCLLASYWVADRRRNEVATAKLVSDASDRQQGGVKIREMAMEGNWAGVIGQEAMLEQEKASLEQHLSKADERPRHKTRAASTTEILAHPARLWGILEPFPSESISSYHARRLSL